MNFRVCIGTALLGVLASAAQLKAAEAPAFKQVEAFGRLPLAFEPLASQTGEGARFLSRGPGYELLLSPREATFVFTEAEQVLPPHRETSRQPSRATTTKVVRMKLEGARATARLVPEKPLPGRTNYLLGKDPSRWRTDVPTFGSVRVAGVYEGVDLVYYGSGRTLEYDFVVAPGADPSVVRVAFEGIETLSVEPDGDLRIGAADGSMRMHKPAVYQESDAGRTPIAAEFRVSPSGRVASFHVAEYDRARPLVIDPLLEYSTFLGEGYTPVGIALDPQRNAYVAGILTSSSARFPGSFAGGRWDTLVTKLSATGNAVVYATYIGGNGDDRPIGIAVDTLGQAHVTGITSSPNFPVANAVVPQFPPGAETAYVAKLNAAGNGFVYSTYLGGQSKTAGQSDWGLSITVDPTGSAWAGGFTQSTDFPMKNPYHATLNGAGGFLTRFDSFGKILYSTYLPGVDFVEAIAVDTAGRAHISGLALEGLPTTPGAFQPAYSEAGEVNRHGDAFVMVLDGTGKGLVFCTYLGGIGAEGVWAGIGIDVAGNTIVAGETDATDFPLFRPFRATGSTFIAGFDPSGRVLFSTLFGGDGLASVQRGPIAVDASGRVAIAGITGDPDLPLKNPYQTYRNTAAFLTQFGPLCQSLEFSTFFASSFDSSGFGVAADSAGSLYLVGSAAMSDLPQVHPIDPNSTITGPFVAKFARPTLTVSAVSPGSGPALGGTDVTIAGSGFQAGAAVHFGKSPAAVTAVSPGSIQATTGPHAAGPADVWVDNPDGTFGVLSAGFAFDACGASPPTANVTAGFPASVCAGDPSTLAVALTGTSPWSILWSDGFLQTGITATTVFRMVTPSSLTTYAVTTVTDANCASTGIGRATIVVTPIPSAAIATPAATCRNASGLLASVPSAGSGATYNWTITNGTITSGAGTNVLTYSVGTMSPVRLDVTVAANGCAQAGSTIVAVTPVATAAVTGSGAICAGSPATIQAALTGVAPWTVTWSDGFVQSGVVASPATRSVTPIASTTYSVSAVRDVTGCAGTQSGLADIVVKPVPPALITPNAAQVCPGSTGNVASTADAGVGAVYAWTVTNGTITAGAGTRQITFTAGGPGNVTLAVTITASNGCKSTDTRVWTILPSPTAALSGPTTACSGQPTNLNVNLTGTPPWNLKWSDGLVQFLQASPATRVVTPATSASFSLVSLTDGAGCAGSVSGSVSIALHQSASAVVTGGGTVCAGDAATISAVVTSATPFSVRWSDGVVQTGPGSTTLTRVVHPFGTTVYKIDAIFDGTCNSVGTGNALVTVGLGPAAALVTAPGSLCAGASGAASVPDAGAGASYTWSLRNGTIDGGQGTRTVTFTVGDTDPAHLGVLVQAGSGCQISGSWDLTVDRRPPAPALTAPGAAVSGDTGLFASVPSAGSDVFVWTVENGTLVSGQGTNAILFTAGAPGMTTVRVVQKTGRGCDSEAAVKDIPVSGFSATRIVPVVVSTGGKGGATFSSELTFTNPGGSTAHVDLTLTPAASLGGGASSTVGQDIGPGQQLVIPDALAFFAGQGSARAAQAAASSGGGSVRASFTNLPAKAVVFGGARTTAPSGAGRAGLAYPAPAAEAFFAVPVAIYGMRETADERLNLALVNAGTAGPIGLKVTLVSDATSARFVLPDTVFLDPGQWVQIGSVLKAGALGSGWALVERISGTDPFYAYGVANDNLTNDGAFLAAVPATRAPSAQVVPSIVETPAFGSELLLVNPGLASVTATLNFIESLVSPRGNSTGFVTETLKPGEQRFIPDVVGYLRAHGASPGPKGAPFAGPLFVRFSREGAAADGFVASRTSTPAPGGGSYGVSYVGVPLAETASSAAWVFGLQQNGSSRSNLGLLNAATNLGPISLRYDVFDGATGKMAGGATVSLFPGQWSQVNAVLKGFGIANGYVRVTRTGGTAPWIAYGVVNDGAVPGAGTGDGSFIAMTPTP